ncbi:hypothetical protein BW737_003720 [Actinomyces ruminis]|uniref:TIGR03083 family protein n=1 Tax=Actinomyces ruminis TaxID=1937003 RepID=A0ABX4MCV0_9ACTO|nr:hypothetical protein BW737_003720 [Actinomyces ruminis]
MARSRGLSEVNRDSVTTTLAVGLGRLYEIVLGLRNLKLHGQWAPQTDGVGPFLPDLLSMHDAVFDFLSLSSQDPGEATRWLSRINTDPTVPRLVSALSAYWDCAAAGPASTHGTVRAWNDVEGAVQPTPEEPALNILGGPNGEPAEYLAWRRAVSTSRSSARSSTGERLADAVEAIWFALGICGRDGALGRPGEVFAAEVLPIRATLAAA